MSFDPQNPRGAPRPPTPPPSTPSSPKPSNYIPPQAVDSGSGLPRGLLIGGIVVVIVVLVLLTLTLMRPGDGAFTPPPATPVASRAAPTVAGSPGSSSVPSSAPPTTIASQVPPSFAGSPPTGYEAFLAHVPETLRASCAPGESSDLSILFSARCASSDGIVVVYNQYADATSMDAAYQRVFMAQEIDPDTGSCEVHTTWPAESAYQVEGQPAGRRLCADVQGSPTIFWTDERLTIYSSATGSDPVRLLQFWTSEAGPVQ
ncbi:MAG TPA: hypothetical protein VH371_11025 [Candidatus Limnocylindrales bacterium]